MKRLGYVFALPYLRACTRLRARTHTYIYIYIHAISDATSADTSALFIIRLSVTDMRVERERERVFTGRRLADGS